MRLNYALLFAEIRFQQTAFLAFEAAYCLFFYLTHTFACQVKFGTNLLKSHLLTAYAEEHLQNIALTVAKLLKGSVYLFGQ